MASFISNFRNQIMVCAGTGCTSSESPKILAAFEKEIRSRKLSSEVKIIKTGCFGLCAKGPIVMIFPEGTCYCHVTVNDVAEIMDEHIGKGRIVKRLLHMEGDGGEVVTSLAETQFYKRQMRIALRNCGVINPESIVVIENAKVEPSLANAAPGEQFQFVRTGYFCKDTKHENTFNRIVGLKDSFPKK